VRAGRGVSWQSDVLILSLARVKCALFTKFGRERQVRLLTAAWCRRIWRLLADERARAVARLTEKNC
jgi:hypothetical protein